MPLTILSGSPKSGKTRQAYLLAAKVNEYGRVLIFTDDDSTILNDKVTWLKQNGKKIKDIYFYPSFSIFELEELIELLNPDLVLIDYLLGSEITDSQLDKYKTPILLVRDTSCTT